MLETHRLKIKILAGNDETPRALENIRLHSPVSVAHIEQLTQAVTVYNNEPAILEFDDAYFKPGSLCLYDKHGVIIPESCLKWGNSFVDAGLDTVPIPNDPITIDDPLVYLCDIRNHWGHFLTDGISRTWARAIYPELANLRSFAMTTPRLNDNIIKFLCMIKLDPWQNLFSYIKFSPQPLRFRKMFVPAPSFSLLNHAYTVHARTTSQVAHHFLRNVDLKMEPRPVYLSRSKSGAARTVRNEIALENELRKKDFWIVQPEDLDISEQISLVNQSSHVFGCWGSAFYNMFFLNNPKQMTTHTICSLTPYRDFLALDTIVGHNSNYIHALNCVSEAEQIWEVDIDAILRYISGL